jgi:hypothetical protein
LVRPHSPLGWDPEDLRELISAYQKCAAETVRRFGGFVARYMGDGVVANSYRHRLCVPKTSSDRLCDIVLSSIHPANDAGWQFSPITAVDAPGVLSWE